MSDLLAPSFYRRPHFPVFNPFCAQSTKFLNEEKACMSSFTVYIKHPSIYSIRCLAPTSSKFILLIIVQIRADTSECSTIGVFVSNGMSLSCL